MTRNALALSLIALAGAAGIGHAQATFVEIGFGPDMLELTPTGIYGDRDNPIVPYVAIKQPGVQVYETAGVWSGGAFFEMPQPVGDDGLHQDVVAYQFRPSPDRAQTIPGVDVIIRKTPAPKAAVWDTRESDEGIIRDLENALGAASWATNASADASVIGGAILTDLDGQGVSRHAVRWVNFGTAELLATPDGVRASEIWSTSDDGTIFLGAISEQGLPSDQPKMKPATSKGIIWTDSGLTVVDASVAGPGAASLALSAISVDNATALASVGFDNLTEKYGVYNMASGDFSLLDGGDINGDGNIDLSDTHNSTAHALSGDGGIVVGSITLLDGSESAALWLRDGGSFVYSDAEAYLTSLGAAGLDGWTLSAVTGISADGSMITGWGVDAQGRTGGWMAVIPAPGSAAMLGVGLAVAARRRR